MSTVARPMPGQVWERDGRQRLITATFTEPGCAHRLRGIEYQHHGVSHRCAIRAWHRWAKGATRVGGGE